MRRSIGKPSAFRQAWITLFLERRPARGYAWGTEDERIRRMLDWTRDLLTRDVEYGFWWPDWGERPPSAEARRKIVAECLATKPRLIPILSHRFIPDAPSLAGNPAFSIYGIDTIYYGTNLTDYFANEFDRKLWERPIGPIRHIPFWSDIIDRHHEAYAYYAKSEERQQMKAAAAKSRQASKPLK